MLSVLAAGRLQDHRFRGARGAQPEQPSGRAIKRLPDELQAARARTEAVRGCFAKKAPFTRYPALLDYAVVALGGALAQSTLKGGYENGRRCL